MASGLAVYVSRGGYPLAAQDSLPGAGQALLDGLSTRRAPMKGFKLTSCSLSSFPKLLGTIPIRLRSRAKCDDPCAARLGREACARLALAGDGPLARAGCRHLWAGDCRAQWMA